MNWYDNPYSDCMSFWSYKPEGSNSLKMPPSWLSYLLVKVSAVMIYDHIFICDCKLYLSVN